MYQSSDVRLPKEYFYSMKMIFSVLALLMCLNIAAQVQILSGPMPGYSEMREVAIWVQLTGPADVYMEYWPENEAENMSRSISVIADDASINTAKLIASSLDPNTKYIYSIVANGIELDIPEGLCFSTQPLWQYRGDPHSFKLLLGSCNYVNEERFDRPGEPYGSGYGIFDKMADEDPDLMLWLGDNIYLREADWGSWSGIVDRYTHTRSLLELQRFLQCTQHYAIWDDHDFGPDNADHSFVHKDMTLLAFELFWANPSSAWDQGIATQFTFGDVDFFLLDNRSFRTSKKLKTKKISILGMEQIDLLIEALKFSRSSFKIIAIGGQFLNDVQTHENYSNYEKERAEIIKRIDKEGIHGVIFVSGDRHAAELNKLELSDGGAIYDFTVSPLTATTYNNESEANTLRIPETYFSERNYGVIEFSGPIGDRIATLSTHRADGSHVWEHIIFQH